MMSLKSLMRNKKKLAIVAIGLFIVLYWGTISYSLQQVGYTTAFEGAKATYHGIRYGGQYYTNTKKRDASMLRFDTQLKFDPDGFYTDQCNLEGEMTSVFIPAEGRVEIPSAWVPQEWWGDTLLWENPRNVYEWNIESDDGFTTFYRMEEWVTVWYISLEAGWDSGPDPLNLADEAQNRRYHDTEVWFEFDLKPSWYFEGADRAYFAIAKLKLQHVKVATQDIAGNQLAPNPSLDFSPESAGSILFIYNEPFGLQRSTTEEEFTAFYHQARTLNPLYFRPQVYSYITLHDFGTIEWFDWGWWAKGDVITLGFQVTQFVVGEWRVKDIDEIPEDYGRKAKAGGAGLPDWVQGLSDWLAGISPWTWLGLGTFGIVAIVVVALVVLVFFFGPGFLLRLIPRRRKG